MSVAAISAAGYTAERVGRSGAPTSSWLARQTGRRSGSTSARLAVAGLMVLALGCRQGNPGTPDPAMMDAAAPGIDAGSQIGCGPYESRLTEPEIFIGPDGLEARLLGLIDGAESELWVMMYLITVDSFVDAFIAAHQRGVSVRVLLDGEHRGNVEARGVLERAGVPVRSAPGQFFHAHTKALLIDGETAVIMSANLAFSSMSDERNYGVVDRDPEDVADLRAIFESDWSDEGYPELSCTRLVVSPINSRSRMLAHISNATETLDVAAFYIADESVQNAIINRSRAGVAVRILLADSRSMSENTQTAEYLQDMGIPVRFMTDVQLHAKLVMVDGVPFVGSQNLSYTSLNDNREIGLMVAESAPATAVVEQFELDWQRGVPF